MVKGSPVDKML